MNKDLRTKYLVRSVPVRKGDVVKVVRGNFKGREGKILTVYRKRWALHIEKMTRDKTNGKAALSHDSGSQVQVPVHPSNCVITTLKIDKNRKALLERKKRVAKGAKKHKEGGLAQQD